MAEYLKDFLVFKKGGKVIFSTCSGLIKDSLLFGGFIEALNSFYNLSLNDDLYQIEGHKFRITFLSKSETQFVGISLIDVNRNKVLEELEFLSNRFLELFPEIENKKYENDVRVFHKFFLEINNTRKIHTGKEFESNYLTYLLEDW
ncbi:MAG: hypothetical protein ACFFBH_12565 [Promethearchaeota archaeon]